MTLISFMYIYHPHNPNSTLIINLYSTGLLMPLSRRARGTGSLYMDQLNNCRLPVTQLQTFLHHIWVHYLSSSRGFQSFVSECVNRLMKATFTSAVLNTQVDPEFSRKISIRHMNWLLEERAKKIQQIHAKNLTGKSLQPSSSTTTSSSNLRGSSSSLSSGISGNSDPASSNSSAENGGGNGNLAGDNKNSGPAPGGPSVSEGSENTGLGGLSTALLWYVYICMCVCVCVRAVQ